MEYDGVILKPDLDEALEHYGVKGMKWRKHLKSAIDTIKTRNPISRSQAEKNVKNDEDRGFRKTLRENNKKYFLESSHLTRAEKLKRKKKNKLSEKWANRRKINYDLKPSHQAYEQLVNRQKKK